MQHERAKYFGKEIALSRGHIPIEILVKPSLANLFVWKIIYSTKDNFHVDAVKIGLKNKIYEGSKINKLDVRSTMR